MKSEVDMPCLAGAPRPRTRYARFAMQARVGAVETQRSTKKLGGHGAKDPRFRNDAPQGRPARPLQNKSLSRGKILVSNLRASKFLREDVAQSGSKVEMTSPETSLRGRTLCCPPPQDEHLQNMQVWDTAVQSCKPDATKKIASTRGRYDSAAHHNL